MMHLTKWFGLSFALHLTAASILILVASREIQHQPKPMTVLLDQMELPDPPQPHFVPEAVRVAASPRMPVAPKAPALMSVPLSKTKPVSAEPAPHPAVPAPQAAAFSRPSEPAPAREIPGATAAQPAAGPGPSVPTAATQTRQGSQAAELVPAETAQVRYLKENFAYIRELIGKHVAYPALARRMKWSGKTTVSFTISEDGTVSALRVVEGSGHQVLDKSALDTVRAVAPFPRPPVRAEIVVPVRFKLQ